MSEPFSSNNSTSTEYQSFQQLHVLESGAIQNNILWNLPFALASDSQQLIIAELDGTLKIWDLTKGFLQALPSDRNSSSLAKSIALSADGRRCYILYDDGCIQVRDLTTGQLFDTFKSNLDCMTPSNFDYVSILISPNERLLIVSDLRKGFEVWELQTKKLLRFESRKDTVFSTYEPMLFSFDGQLLLERAKAKTNVYESHSGTLLYSIVWEDGREVRPLSIASDGKTVLGLDRRGFIQQWQLDTGEMKQRWILSKPEASSFRMSFFSSDGTVLCGLFQEGTIQLWNWQTGELLKSLSNSGYSRVGYAPQWIQKVQFTPDDRFIVTHGTDRTIRIWGNAEHQSDPDPFRYEEDMLQRRAMREQWIVLEAYEGAFD